MHGQQNIKILGQSSGLSSPQQDKASYQYLSTTPAFRSTAPFTQAQSFVFLIDKME
jgi:hypothetical protein